MTRCATGLIERRPQTILDEDGPLELDSPLIESQFLLGIEIQEGFATASLRLQDHRHGGHDQDAGGEYRGQQSDLHPPVLVQSA